MIIVLLGYMGVGKTVIGKQLAKILNYSFVDLDEYIEEKENTSVSELFKTKGEIYFRKQEHVYLKTLLLSEKKIVLSVGGGTPCYAGNMNLIIDTDCAVSFYLQSSPIQLAARLFLEREGRPLIKHIKTQDELTTFIGIHLFERQFFYNKASHLIKTTNLSQQDTVAAIIEKLY